MSMVLKFKNAVAEKIRYIEEGMTNLVHERDIYATGVGHKAGLQDALTILDQVLGEMAEPEDKPHGIEDDENA